MIRGFSRRGQPLAVLAMVMGCWVSARVVLWDASAMPMPAASAPVAVPPSSESVAIETPAPVSAAEPARSYVPVSVRNLGFAARKTAGKLGMAMAFAPALRDTAYAYDDANAAAYAPAAASRPNGGERMTRVGPAKFAAASLPRARGPILFQQGHASPGWTQVLAARQADDAFAPDDSGARSSRYFPTPPGRPYVHNAPAASRKPARVRRWSADAWYYWRRGSSAGLSQGAFAPSYGASQAGGVLRYRLAPSSRYRPTAFLRTTAALNGSGEREVALGLSARPVPSVPVVVAGEARYSQTPNGKEVRPAAFAYTELPPFKLPLGLRGEAYAQGGYVGGRNATPFVDGSVRADRKLLRLDKPELRVGGGIWGGAQKGAARLDAGPSVIMVTPIGNKVFARLAADWRFRVAGDAAPDSGPAVTLSAGF